MNKGAKFIIEARKAMVLACTSLLLFFAQGSVNAQETVDEPTQVNFTQQDTNDATCVLVFSYILGTEKDSMSSEEQVGLASSVTYFYGKIRGRYDAETSDKLFTKSLILKLQDNLVEEITRCSQEMLDIGNSIDDLRKKFLSYKDND